MIDEAVKICHDGVMPFIVVCSSSGTGKTQLPFSLDYPLLYFTAVETSQCKIFNYHQIVKKSTKYHVISYLRQLQVSKCIIEKSC